MSVWTQPNQPLKHCRAIYITVKHKILPFWNMIKETIFLSSVGSANKVVDVVCSSVLVSVWAVGAGSVIQGGNYRLFLQAVKKKKKDQVLGATVADNPAYSLHIQQQAGEAVAKWAMTQTNTTPHLLSSLLPPSIHPPHCDLLLSLSPQQHPITPSYCISPSIISTPSFWYHSANTLAQMLHPPSLLGLFLLFCPYSPSYLSSLILLYHSSSSAHSAG